MVNALPIMLTGSSVRPDKAKKIGLVDFVVQPIGEPLIRSAQVLGCFLFHVIIFLEGTNQNLHVPKASEVLTASVGVFVMNCCCWSRVLSILLLLWCVHLCLGPGLKPIEERTQEYFEEVAIDTAK